MAFSPEERALLAKYVTNVDSNIFAITGLPGIVGAAFARYSRAVGSFKETFVKEFLKRDARIAVRSEARVSSVNPSKTKDAAGRNLEEISSGGEQFPSEEGVIDPKHAEELIERILVAYGDDSVGELEGANVSFEGISNLASKIIEDKRIGGSPIEQSSRYVFYDQKEEVVNSADPSVSFRANPAASGMSRGIPYRWKYLRPKEIMQSPHAKEYEHGIDRIFQIYHDLIEPMNNFYAQKKPLEEAEYDVLGKGEKQQLKDLKEERDIKAFKRTYNFDLKTKTCDTIRVILPVATLTNVGMFGNGRYFQELISHLLTQDVHEMQDIGERCHTELKKIIGPYVKRAKRNEWLADRRRPMRELGAEIFKDQVEKSDQIEVELLPSEPNRLFLLSLASMLYPYCEVSLSKVIDKISKMSEEEHYEILETYVGGREHRRHRPDRALEAGYPLLFDIVMDFGSYRDLQRHRMFTQQRQLITPNIGFSMPDDLIEAGLGAAVAEAREISESLYKKIRQDLGSLVAQYPVLFGHNIRFSIGANLRAMEHMIELRTVPQGHPNYRKVCQLMARAILDRYPWTKEILKFTDFNEYTWARGDSEARQRVKEKKLDEKYQPVEKK